MTDRDGSVPADSQPAGKARRWRHTAMGTTFGVRIAARGAEAARRAAEGAFDELDRLERELSRFNPYSDVSQLNGVEVGRRVRMGIATFECLQLARQVWRATDGAFDVTLGALLDLWLDGRRPIPLHRERSPIPLHRDWSLDWGLERTGGEAPGDEAPSAAPAPTGMDLLALEPDGLYAARLGEGVAVDLGGIGKGYALDRMAEVLAEGWDVDAVLLDGGQSTVLAVGRPPGEDGWPVALRAPAGDEDVIGRLRLADRALSGSATTARRHIIDPRTRRPAEGTVASWVLAPTAAEADSLSTAFVVMSPEEVERYCREHDVSAMLAVGRRDDYAIVRFGPWPIR